MICGFLIVLSTAVTALPAEGDSVLSLSNASVKVEVSRRGGEWKEVYSARRGTDWVRVAESGSATRPEPWVRIPDAAPDIKFTEAYASLADDGTTVLHMSAAFPPGRIDKTIRLDAHAPHASVRIAYHTGGPRKLISLQSTLSFVPEGKAFASYHPLDFVFTPQLRPEPEQVIADHVFRSPAFMMQKGGIFLALVPDLGEINARDRVMKSTGDLQVETGPWISYGLQNWMTESYKLRNTHVFYASPDSLAAGLSDTTVSFGFDVFVSATAPVRQGYRTVVRYLWETYGEAGINRQIGPQSAPFSVYIHKAWDEYLPTIALDTTFEEKPITLLRQGRLSWSNGLPASANNDTWFNVWFNALRTSYGMYLAGKERGDASLMSRSERVLNLALLAPQNQGLAPTIFYLDSTGGHWVADHAWGGISHGEYLPMFHNAWTGHWMLEWARLVPQRRAEILRFTRRLGDFLVSHQRSSGVIPSWYDSQTLVPAAQLRDDNAETAGAVLFLADLSTMTGNKKYLAAAERGMAYIVRDVMPQQKWFDFETFFSCSRKPLNFFDRYTQQYPQNTLSMHQASEACRILYRATGSPAYKEWGCEILDYLCLYQQVWSPVWLSRELFGGFGVQNTDAEWSDARQGYFAVTLMDYYDLTGRREYFERGVAALRAMFSLFESPASPRTAENYAHSGHDEPAGVTGIHWGTGSSVVSIHIIRQRYGDAMIHAAGQWGCGIDGCRISNVATNGSTIRFSIQDNVSSPRRLRVTFAGLSKPRYSLVINGAAFGSFTSQQLKKGVSVAV